MSNRENIRKNLVQFKQRYWLARLLRGLLIFSGTGLVFFGFVALLEYVSWLSIAQRTALFVLTVAIESILLVIYILLPITQILVNGKRLTDRNAAVLIGEKLDGVGDKLLNFLELQSSPTNELVDAGIEQKGEMLLGFPFYKAITLSSLKPFLLFLIPPLVMLAYFVSGNRWHMLSEGADRLIHFSTAYQKELPFKVSIISPLSVAEGSDYELKLELEGNAIPDQVEIETNLGRQILQRKAGNSFSATFNSCLNDIDFAVVYDEIRSAQFHVLVIKKPVIGRVSINVVPPAYTGLEAYSANNLKEIDVPQGSKVSVRFAIKNATNMLFFAEQNGFSDTLSTENADGEARLKLVQSTTIVAMVENERLGELRLNAVKDYAPNLSVTVDSSLSGLGIKVQANDDYAIIGATLVFVSKEDVETALKLPVKGQAVDSYFTISYEEAAQLKTVKVGVSDHLTTVTRVLDIAKHTPAVQTNTDLLDAAGTEMNSIKELKAESEKASGAKSEKTKEQAKKEAEELLKVAEELVQKDSVQFERFRQLSQEIKDIIDQMDKQVPIAQQKLQEKKLEEALKQLEQEWAILKTIEQLKKMDESIKEKPFAEDAVMKELAEAKKELDKQLESQEKRAEIDWKKFEELQKENAELKKKEAGDDNSGGEKKEKQKTSEDEKSSDEIKEDMKEDSDALKKQLAQMSDIMAMEAMEKNIELLRRLELRAMKASLKQEMVYRQTQTKQEVDNRAVASQKEIVQAATSVLDSLAYVIVNEEQLAEVLKSNVDVLEQHIGNLKSLQDISYSNLVSGQRYLQYGLNDLASVLYDILKSESNSLQSMMAGGGACKNPKPGKGKKKSLSQQQKELGDKMGKKKGQGLGVGEQGKNGRQTLSQSELLELIKGQEEIISQYKKEGGGKAGESDVLNEMNKQLDDLMMNNLDKAMKRNQEIEDKLIIIEESINQKKEDKMERKSQENLLDYDAIKQRVFQDYTKAAKAGSGIVILPALKQYYTVKWVKVALP